MACGPQLPSESYGLKEGQQKKNHHSRWLIKHMSSSAATNDLGDRTECCTERTGLQPTVSPDTHSEVNIVLRNYCIIIYVSSYTPHEGNCNEDATEGPKDF